MKNIIVSFFLVINALLLISFIMEMYVINKNTNPKIKANLCAAGVFLFVTYLIMCTLYGLYGILELDLRYLIFIIYLVVPFILGKFVKHKNLKSYSTLQLMSYVASFLTLIDLL